jgi:hypothetical protein
MNRFHSMELLMTAWKLKLQTSDPNVMSPSSISPFPGEPTSVSDLGMENQSIVLNYGQLLVAPIEDVCLSGQTIMAELGLFLSNHYQRYPIIHMETLLGKVERGEYSSDGSLRSLLLTIFLLNETAQFRRTPDRGTARIELLSRAIEQLRANPNDYHFADFPSLDALITSLFLFIAYSVRDYHNRAFTYLTEAIGLMDLVEYPCDGVEMDRYHRIECTLYVTEAASNYIYGAGRRRRIARPPLNLTVTCTPEGWYLQEGNLKGLTPPFSTLDFNTLDKEAVNLLVSMVRIYGALDTTEVSKVSFNDNFIAAMNEGNEQKSLCSIQTADTAITRQWQLALHWWRDLPSKVSRPQVKDSARYTVQIIGMTAIQRTRCLRPEECRIVGHGKLAALADVLFNISSTIGILPNCSSLIGQLIRIVSETDYERFFAPDMSLIELCIGEVPRSLTSDKETESVAPNADIATSDLLIGFQCYANFSDL